MSFCKEKNLWIALSEAYGMTSDPRVGPVLDRALKVIDQCQCQDGGWQYEALRVAGARLDAANPFELLADRLPGAKEAMGEFTLLVAGMQFQEGPGFVILAGSDVPGAELLLDATCAVTTP